MKILSKYFIFTALALTPSIKALAQDVTMRFDSDPVEGAPGYEKVRGSIWAYTKDGIKVQYIPGVTQKGASIYNTWADYDIIITSTKPITAIELDGYSDTSYATNTNDVVCTTGTLKMHPDETSIWTGKNSSLTLRGAQSSSRYYFTEMRFWFEGTPYGKQYVADPTITATNGKLSFATTTPGTTFTYNMQLATDGKTHMCDGTVTLALPLVVSVQGAAAGYENSATTTETIPFATLYGKQGDTDGNGRLELADLQAIINNLLKKSTK